MDGNRVDRDWPYRTTRWKELRETKLASSPVCERCSTWQDLHVHHRQPLTLDERIEQDESAGFPAIDDLETLCRSCHSVETNSPSKNGYVHRAEWRDFAGGLK